MTVTVVNGELMQSEIDVYIRHIQVENPNRSIASIELTVDGDYVNAKYYLSKIPFSRIRRITGYLTGDTSKWNNAKQAELRDRTKSKI